jgi:hypothetical protein
MLVAVTAFVALQHAYNASVVDPQSGLEVYQYVCALIENNLLRAFSPDRIMKIYGNR